MATVGIKGLNVQCDVTLCLCVALHNHDVTYIQESRAVAGNPRDAAVIFDP